MSVPAGEPATSASAAPTAIGAPVRLAMVGVSVQSHCGVRDHATLLAEELGRERVSCSVHWLSREHLRLRPARAEVRAWTRQLADELQQQRPHAVLLHYSAFSYSYRGVPVFVRGVLSALAWADVPTLGLMHELAYPWGQGGWRGRLWATTQRAAMLQLTRACDAVVVTADFQQRWLATRRWLPRRPMRMAPVFSNLPPPREQPRRGNDGNLIGVFGYAYQGAAVSLVLDAVALLRDQGMRPRLTLLGAPGRASAAADRWLSSARERDLHQLLSFAGPLPAPKLSDALAGCDVLVSCDASGPSSRKGTLAASLASGTAVVAIDGPRRWSELIEGGAAELVQPTPQALAGALAGLLADAQRRHTLGARGQAFARQRMGLGRTAEAVTALLDDLLPGRQRAG